MKLFHSTKAGQFNDRDLGGIFRMGGNIRYEPAVTLNADGKASFSFTIPNDPSLSGRMMYLQALVEDAGGSHPTTLTDKADLMIQ